MKSALTVLALVGASNAYPSIAAHLGQQNAKRQVLPELPLIKPGFDAEAQYVSNTGDHEFEAPSDSDQRGPCPGLNAMANHNYLPHNGIATITELVEACEKVFGMAVDLGTTLAVYGAVFEGDLTSWSIGGPDSRVNGLGSLLLGTPQGISRSHNNYEGDGSPTRGDLYTDGNDYLLNMDNFQELFDAGKADDNYDLQLLTELRHKRFQRDIHTNPYFFNAPFAGVIAQPAAWAFVYRLMSNKSEEYPEGRLDATSLKSFYAITGEDGDFKYTPGHEKIPDNWYTRNALDQYSVPYLSLDGLYMSTQYTEFFTVGGNTGTVDSFVGLDPANLTSTVYNADTLLQGNNSMCYGLQLTQALGPDLLSGIWSTVDKALDTLTPALKNITDMFGCPGLENVDKNQFAQFPGFTKKYKSYNPPPAKTGLLGLGVLGLL